MYLSGFCKYEGQIGVNTSNPQGTFHIDGAKDNALTGSPTPAQLANDVVVSISGNVGLGTLSPSAKLDVASAITSKAIRITDGSEGNGKILTSNTDGFGTWSVAPTATKAIVTATTTSTATTSATQGVFTYIPDLRLNFPVSGYYSLSIEPYITNASVTRDTGGYVARVYLRNTTTLATSYVGVVNIPPGWPYGGYGYAFSSVPFQYVSSGTYEVGVITLSNAAIQQSTIQYMPGINTVVGILLAQ